MLHKKKIKNHYPILVSLVFFIYVSATAFILIFSASIGSVLASEKNLIGSLPYVTTLDVQEDFVKIDVDNNRIYYSTKKYFYFFKCNRKNRAFRFLRCDREEKSLRCKRLQKQDLTG